MIRIEINRNVDAVWPTLLPSITEACEACGNEMAPGQINQEIRSGHWAMLVALDDDDRPWGCAVFKFEAWPSGLKLRTLLMAGENLALWFDEMYDAIAECGRLGGANGLVTQSRKGWHSDKILGKKPGFKVLGYIAEVPI